MLRFESMCRENRLREVPQVCRDDRVRSRYGGGCENVAVVGVGQLDFADQILEAGDQGIADMRVHETAGTLQTLRSQIRSIAEERSNPLLVDECGPLGSVQVRDGEFEQQIAQRRGVQDGSVKKGNSRRQGSIAHAKFLCVGR